MIFGLALIMNVGSVSAATQTNTTVQSHTTVQSTTTTTKVTTTVKKTTTKKVATNSYGLTTAQIKDGLNRAQVFYNKKNRLPNYVTFGSKKISITNFQKILTAYGLKIVVKTYANGWVTVKNLVYDHQDTSYTCGPSSLKMELSDYGLSLNEMALASYSSSNSNVGTTHSGLINAVKKVNSIYGTKFSAWDSNFSSVGWAGLYKYISTNHPVILHIRSFLNPNTSGHYVVLAGLNMNSGLAKLADPSYGYRTISFSALLSRMNWVVSTGRTTKPVIFVN
jgi:predicted double-glycine peptidase